MLVVDEGFDGDGALLSFLFFGFIGVCGEPLFPVVFLIFVGRDPVEEDHDVLRLGVFDGRFREDGAAAHVDEAFVLLVVFH